MWQIYLFSQSKRDVSLAMPCHAQCSHGTHVYFIPPNTEYQTNVTHKKPLTTNRIGLDNYTYRKHLNIQLEKYFIAHAHRHEYVCLCCPSTHTMLTTDVGLIHRKPQQEEEVVFTVRDHRKGENPRRAKLRC